MNKHNNHVLCISIILNVILSITLMFSIYRFNKQKPLEYIKGCYQCTEYLPDLYEANFTDKKFVIKLNDKIKKGTYTKYKNNLYMFY